MENEAQRCYTTSKICKFTAQQSSRKEPHCFAGISPGLQDIRATARAVGSGQLSNMESPMAPQKRWVPFLPPTPGKLTMADIIIMKVRSHVYHGALKYIANKVIKPPLTFKQITSSNFMRLQK